MFHPNSHVENWIGKIYTNVERIENPNFDSPGAFTRSLGLITPRNSHQCEAERSFLRQGLDDVDEWRDHRKWQRKPRSWAHRTWKSGRYMEVGDENWVRHHKQPLRNICRLKGMYPEKWWIDPTKLTGIFLHPGLPLTTNSIINKWHYDIHRHAMYLLVFPKWNDVMYLSMFIRFNQNL